MNTYKNQSFSKTALRFGIIFLIFITLLNIVFTSIISGFQGMIHDYFSKDTWKNFVITQLTMSVIYGLLVAVYYKYIKKD